MKSSSDGITGSAGDAAETCVSLFKDMFGIVPQVETLPRAGGDRRYFRLSAPCSPSVIGTSGSDVNENSAFVGLARSFRSAGINVPEIYASDLCRGVYLQEDLGDTALLQLLPGRDRIPLARKSLVGLVSMQTADKSVWGRHVVAKPFSRRLVMWDLNYFKYEFLKPAGIVLDEELLEDDFERLSADLATRRDEVWGFMYRDFQSRNIMIKEGEPYFIDFQGGRMGPLLYDAVSFLWQSKASFSTEEREVLLRDYARTLAEARGIREEDIVCDVDKMALLRTLQVLGAYGFRGLVEKRAHFIESIPGALSNLSELIGRGVLEPYEELRRVCVRAVESRFSNKCMADALTVKVFSFSYKKGYPEDLSGNGGGFMFDCRGMHNPGRYEEYRNLTGLDRAVIAFLEDRGEVSLFLDSAFSMVKSSVESYSRRGFRSLQVGFGCTGGRHRSVYCAQRMAERLAVEFPDVRVELFHREQEISMLFNGSDSTAADC